MTKPGYGIMNNKGAGQPAHPCSLITAFIIHCHDNIISIDSESPRLMLASVAEQTSFKSWLATPPEDRFSCSMFYSNMMREEAAYHQWLSTLLLKMFL